MGRVRIIYKRERKEGQAGRGRRWPYVDGLVFRSRSSHAEWGTWYWIGVDMRRRLFYGLRASTHTPWDLWQFVTEELGEHAGLRGSWYSCKLLTQPQHLQFIRSIRLKTIHRGVEDLWQSDEGRVQYFWQNGSRVYFGLNLCPWFCSFYIHLGAYYVRRLRSSEIQTSSYSASRASSMASGSRKFAMSNKIYGSNVSSEHNLLEIGTALFVL